MPDPRPQSQLREHLAQIRHAVKGIGHDFSLEIQNLDHRISQLSDKTGMEAERASLEIRRDLSHLKTTVDRDLRRVPGALSDVGQTLGTKTREAAGAARDAVSSAGHSAKEGTQNLFARAAGVKRRPMREWQHPDPGSETAEPEDKSPP